MKSLRADSYTDESMKELMEAHTDITGAKHVEAYFSHDKTVLWVNVNGVCVLRICQIQNLIMQVQGGK